MSFLIYMFNFNAIIMKKIFSFLVLFLLSSYMATSVLAQDTPPFPVKFSDNNNEHPYYIGFTRQKANAKYWTVDHEVSGTIAQEVLREEDKDAIQRWKFVLTGLDSEEFYIQNVASGEYVSYHAGGAETQFTDTYGKLIPIGDGRETQDVYYTDKGTTPSKFTLEYRDNIGEGGWVFMDKSGSSLNERGGYNTCKWGPDAGNLLLFVVAGEPAITPGASSLSMGSLVDKKTEGRIGVTGRFLTEDISISFEGPDAECFSYTVTGDLKKQAALTIAFTPKELREHTATLKFKSTGIEASVDLTGAVYPDSDMPTISEGDDETWYYIQFLFDKGENLAWTTNGDNKQITREVIPAGAYDDRQLWKIMGDWEKGYYFVNKALNGELKYNQALEKNPGTVLPGLIYDGAADGGPDIYFAWGDGGGLGDTFNFVKDKNGNWQLFNRDVNSAPTSTTRETEGYDARYVYARHKTEGFPLVLRQSAENTERTQIIFTLPKASVVSSVTGSHLLTASAGETSDLEISLTGVGTQAPIKATLTGDDAFSLSTTSLPATGGDLTVTFSPDADGSFYQASLTLSSEGAEDVVIALTGSYGGPILSLEDDIWHTMRFNRRASVILQGNGIGADKAISQKAPIAGDPSQEWRFVGSNESLIIENRAGGYIYFIRTPDGNPCTALTDNEAEAAKFSLVLREEGSSNPGWVLKDIGNGTGRMLNDFQGTGLCTYTTDGNDGGCPIVFTPVELVNVGRKIIKATPLAINLKTPVGKTATAKVDVTTIAISGAITGTVTGEGFSIDKSSLPETGGELTVTFAPTEADKDYKATLTLSNPGADKDVVISLSGVTPPTFSTADNEVWYYIQFERSVANPKIAKDEDGNNIKDENGEDVLVQQNAVWQGNGMDEIVTQKPLVRAQQNQHWKFVGEWDDKFKIVNREGGEIIFLDLNDEGKVTGNPTLTMEGAGDDMSFVESNKWTIQLTEYFFNEDTWGCMNDHGGNAADIGIWNTEDAGDYLLFIPIDKGYGSGIESPAIDPNDEVVSTRYYTVQGVEVKKPTATGIYIIRRLYASGKTQAVKQLILVK